MSKILTDVSIVGNDVFRSFGPATASVSSLTFSTDFNKSLSITVIKPVILKEVTIYTRVGDFKHIDPNNRFQIVVASGSTIYATNVNWQSSWNATASGLYYSFSNYTFSSLLNSTPLPQKLKLDFYLDKGSYNFYLDETYNTTGNSDNVGYILMTTQSNYPYSDSSFVVNGTSSFNQRNLSGDLGNIFFNWVVSDADLVTIDNGSFGLVNSINSTQSSFSLKTRFNIYSDSNFSGAIINALYGTGSQGNAPENVSAATASFNSPRGLRYRNGILYFCDSGSHRVKKIDNGILSTVVGSGSASSLGDGGSRLSASIWSPYDVEFDNFGDMYIVEQAGNRIRKVDMNTDIISTYAGNGSSGTQLTRGDDGLATAASLSSPESICFDSQNNLYIADTGLNRVRRVDWITKIITTYAGNGTTGNSDLPGGNTASGVNAPRGVAADSNDNIYISTTVRVKKVSNGTMSNYLGGGSPTTTNPVNTPLASLGMQQNTKLLIKNDFLYLCDRFNYRIHEVNMLTELVTKIVGTGSAPSSTGDGNLSIIATINNPDGIAIDNAGNLIIADTGGFRIRQVGTTATEEEFFAIKNKNYSTPTSATASIVLKRIGITTSSIFKIGAPTSYPNYFNDVNDSIVMANSSGNFNWITYSSYANAISRTFNYWIGGTAGSSDFISRVTASTPDLLPGLPTASRILDLKTVTQNKIVYQIYNASNNTRINITGSVFQSNGTNSNYYFVLPNTTVNWPGWKITII
jgi:sugar lactone lactonase YvrE